MSRARRGARSHAAGLAAEESALRWYQARGAALLARRWRCEAGEIDLILRTPESIVFVEVKQRGGAVVDSPVSEAQWRRLETAAETYMMVAETGDAPVRFDLALVDGEGGVNVIENARMNG